MKGKSIKHQTVYSPESDIRSPRRLILSMFRDLRDCRELAWRLFIRDVSAKYRQSLLGILWAFIPPILTGAIFIILQSKKIVNFGHTDIPYPVFALVGTTLWQLFTESLNAPLISVNTAKPMITKINFPREALILSAFYQVLFNLLIKSLIIIAILIYFHLVVGWSLLLAFPVILILILLGITIGLFLTPFGMLYTDISSSLIVVTQLWFFVTPVVYPPPKSFPFSLLATANPVAPILVAARDLLTKGHLTNLAPLVIITIFTFIGLFVAWLIYRLAVPIIIERISA